MIIAKLYLLGKTNTKRGETGMKNIISGVPVFTLLMSDMPMVDTLTK